MKRRRLLGALAGVAAAAGCTGPAADGPDDSAGTPADPTDTTGADERTVESVPADAYDVLGYDLPPPGGEYPSRPSPAEAALAQRTVGPYHLAVATDSAGGQALADHLRTLREADPAGFLDATAFDAAVVVALRDLQASSSPDLSVRAVRRGPSWIGLDVAYPGRVATSDVAEEVLLVRIPRGENATRAAERPGESTHHATVTFADGPAFSTVGRYGRVRLDPPRDVVVRNRDCRAYRIDVRATMGRELVYVSGRHEPSPPASLVRHGGVLGAAGEYRIAVDYFSGEASTRTETLETTLEPDGDRNVLVDVGGNGTASVRAVAVPELPTEPPGGCESAALPDESSDPAENLDDPVGISWTNRGPTAVEVDLEISDGDRGVVERTLTLSAGSKGHTEPLIARKGVYDVTIGLDDGSRTVRWDVRKGPLKLLVDRDGRLQVAQSSLAD